MARFFLMLDGVRILTLDDLKAHFKPLDALDRFRSGALQRWLAEQHLDDLLAKVKAIDEPSDEAAIRALGTVFGLANYAEESLGALDEALCNAETDEEIKSLFEGPDGERNLARLEKLANEGNLNAQNQLALMYAKGIPSLKDQPLFFRNNPQAMYLKAIYILKNSENGDGGEEAVQYLEKAAELGIVDAYDALGSVYLDGLGSVGKNTVFAIKWFREAAKRGSPQGMFHFGKCLVLGRGVGCNFVEGAEYLAASLQHGCTEATAWLAYCYINGTGGIRDYEKAFQLALIAAENEIPMGERILGQCFEHGWGVEKDIKKAVKYYEKAADKGDANAADLCRRCRKKHVWELYGSQ